MHASPRVQPVDMTGPGVIPATSSRAHPGRSGQSPKLGGTPDGATASPPPDPAPRPPSQTDNGLSEALARLLKTAQREIDRHINDHGLCAICGSAFPCERAALADLALSAV